MARLEVMAAELTGVGVVGLFERLIADVWRVNCQRYEPSEIGDTPRSLGVTASENLRVRLLREVGGTSSEWRARGVKAGAPDNSLLLAACGYEVRQMKAPQTDTRIPGWSSFDWASESDARYRCAEANSAVYRSEGFGVGGQGILPILAPVSVAGTLTNALVVWSGRIETGETAGWLGLPILGDEPWLAVKRLWWHDFGAGEGLPRPVGDEGRGYGGFDEQPEPMPKVVLKPQREERKRP